MLPFLNEIESASNTFEQSYFPVFQIFRVFVLEEINVKSSAISMVSEIADVSGIFSSTPFAIVLFNNHLPIIFGQLTCFLQLIISKMKDTKTKNIFFIPKSKTKPNKNSIFHKKIIPFCIFKI